MKNVKLVIKLLFLTPISALILASLAFTTLNYPSSRATVISPKWSEIGCVATTISEITTKESLGKSALLAKKDAFSILNTCVRISVAPTSSQSGSQGSGVLFHIEEVQTLKFKKFKSYILTNYHVTRGSLLVTVEVFKYLEDKIVSGITKYTGRILCSSPELDVSMIEVISSNPIGQPLDLLDEVAYEDLSLNDPIYICGCPLGDPPTITSGSLSQVTTAEYTATTFAIFGNSGGGAFTADRKIAGIVKQIRAVQTPDGQIHPLPNISRIIPSLLIKQWLLTKGYQF